MPYRSLKCGSIFVHCECNGAAVAAIRENNAAYWTEGAKIGYSYRIALIFLLSWFVFGM